MFARESMSDRVARGISLLDAELTNWRASIDLSKLHMHSPTHCILGQLYGDFTKGSHYLFGPVGRHRLVNHEQNVAHGFHLHGDESLGLLKEAWKQALSVKAEMSHVSAGDD